MESDPASQHVRVRRAGTAELSSSDVGVIRSLLTDAFGPDEDDRFSDDDWEHALGGVHFIVEIDDVIVGHAAVVERDIQVRRRSLRTGYVEAVAIAPALQGTGLGSRLMEDVSDWIRGRFELGALGTGRHHFYERLGWRTWRGPSSVRTRDGTVRTPDDDGFILVLQTPTSPALDLTGPISCEWRPGDVW